MRLFVALHFSPDIRRVLLDAIGDIRAQARQANTTRPENLHLTLAFIGETEAVAAAREAVDACVRPAFVLTVGGSGRFGDLYWAGIRENPALSQLAGNVRDALRQRGFAIESRPFSPHVTLARQVRCDTPLRLALPETAMTVRRISLMKSERINGRLTYTEVHGRDLP